GGVRVGRSWWGGAGGLAGGGGGGRRGGAPCGGAPPVASPAQGGRGVRRLPSPPVGALGRRRGRSDRDRLGGGDRGRLGTHDDPAHRRPRTRPPGPTRP